MPRKLNAVILLLVGAAFLFVWTGSGMLRNETRSSPDFKHRQSSQAAQRQAVRRAIPKLDWADAETLRIAGRELAAIERFFDDAERRAPAFANEVLGWRSKWRFVADRVPLTRGDRHDEFLRQAFTEHLFTTEQLAQVVEQAIQNELDALTGIENQMLVRIRADLSDLPPHALPQLADQHQWAAAYEQALLAGRERIGANLKSELSSEMVSLIAGEAMTVVAVRLGVSAGVLAVGAGSSLPTLGIGLVVGLIVDQIIAFVWDWWHDPRGELAAEVSRKLGDIRQSILDGDDNTLGLRGKLQQFARERAELRREAVLTLLNPAGARQ